MPPIRVNVYIDGFNVYHRINKWRKDNPQEDYRWLDYRKALAKMLNPSEVLQGVRFFTAIGYDTGPESIQRHQTFIDALQAVGVETVYGKFLGKGKNRKEKQTDINIAARALTDAANNEFDRCFLVSSDNDFVPLLKSVQQPPFNKQAGLITTPYDQKSGAGKRPINDLIAATSKTSAKKPLVRRWRFEDLAGCSFPAVVVTERGRKICKPEEYKTF